MRGVTLALYHSVRPSGSRSRGPGDAPTAVVSGLHSGVLSVLGSKTQSWPRVLGRGWDLTAVVA